MEQYRKRRLKRRCCKRIIRVCVDPLRKRKRSRKRTKAAHSARNVRRGTRRTASLGEPNGSNGPQGPVSQPRLPAVSIHPVVRRYFLIPAFDIPLAQEQVIFANQFVNDQGEAADGFSDFNEEGYFNLYVNGVLQEGKLFSVNAQSVTIIPTGQTIYAGTPIILESVGFIVNVS